MNILIIACVFARKQTNLPGYRPKWIMAMLAISTQWESIWVCSSYPRRGSHIGVKSTLSQQSTLGIMFPESLHMIQMFEKSLAEKLAQNSFIHVMMTLWRYKSFVKAGSHMGLVQWFLTFLLDDDWVRMFCSKCVLIVQENAFLLLHALDNDRVITRCTNISPSSTVTKKTCNCSFGLDISTSVG